MIDSITAAQGVNAVARSSWVETRAKTSLTAGGAIAPISASVDTLWRRRSCKVRAESPGGPRAYLIAGECELLRKEMADVTRTDKANRAVHALSISRHPVGTILSAIILAT